MWFLRLFVFCAIACRCVPQTADPVWAPLDRAYTAARQREYDAAIDGFREALRLAPTRLDIRKDLGYTLLKAGETALARDEFAEAMRLAPADDQIALEYAFLSYETKQTAQARRTFDRIRRKGNAVAETAFQNIDAQLAAGIERWQQAVDLAPGKYSAHEELAALAEQRDELELARRHYEAAWKLRPDHRAFLLALGRVLHAMGRETDSNAALLAASRGAEPRVAEAAREILPARYPWVSEFRAALVLDPANLELRRELAWLYLAMAQKTEAEAEFRRLTEAAPDDAWSLAQLGFLLLERNDLPGAIPLLEKAASHTEDDELQDRIRATLKLPRKLRSRADVPRENSSAQALELAQRSLDAGYLNDALKYLRIAHENDPLDFSVMLKLGWTYNILHDDRQATGWFRLARNSDDPAIADEARRAWGNLSPQFARLRNTFWAYPVYSSRWRDVFTYAQLQTEFMPRWGVRPYLSVRFAGDARGSQPASSAGALPAYLSENAAIFAAGVRTRSWLGAVGWAEAGYAASYLHPAGQSRLRPDLRGGIAWSRSLGHGLAGESAGWFLQTNADALYVSRFDRDTLLNVPNKLGWTLLPGTAPGLQAYWNFNLTADARRYQWANSVETGPGVRIRFGSAVSPLLLSVDALRGLYTVLDGTRPPRYSDIRIGLWYALTR